MILPRRYPLRMPWLAGAPLLEGLGQLHESRSGTTPGGTPLSGKWAYLLPDPGGQIRSIQNVSYFHEAGRFLQEVCDATYYTGRTGEVHSISSLLNADSYIASTPGNEKWYPRYFDTGNPADISCRAGMPQQSAAGASTFTGVMLRPWEAQPTIAPTGPIVTGERPAFTQIIGGPAAREPEPGMAPPRETVRGSIIPAPGVRPSGTILATSAEAEEDGGGGIPWLWLLAGGGLWLLASRKKQHG